MKKKKLNVEIVKMDCKTGATTYKIDNVFPTPNSIEMAWEARDRYVDAWQAFPTLEDFVECWPGYSLAWLRNGFGELWVDYFHKPGPVDIIAALKKRRKALKEGDKKLAVKYEDTIRNAGVGIEEMDVKLAGKGMDGVECEILNTDNEHQIQSFPVYECHSDGTLWTDGEH